MNRAEEFRQLHHGTILVLPNVWDVASSALVASVPGCRALATTSSGVAASLGYPDGERIPAAEMLAVVTRIAAAADLPVTADLEAGYGDPVATAIAAIAAGVAGMNLEDKAGPADEHVERIKAIRAAVGDAIVLNARIDVFLHGTGDVDEAVERANAYLGAGADCTFPIGVSERAKIAALAKRIDGPVNVLATADTPPVSKLEELGVARVTFGSSFTRAAYGAAVRGAHEVISDGTYGWLEGAVPQLEVSQKPKASATIDAASRGGAVR